MKRVASDVWWLTGSYYIANRADLCGQFSNTPRHFFFSLYTTNLNWVTAFHYFFCPLSGPNESGTKHLSKQCQAVDASQNTCVTLSFNQKIEGRCSEKVTDFNEEIANRTSENDAKQTLGGLAQSLPQDKSARIHTQIIHLDVKESNHSRSEIPKVVQPDLQIRLCSTPRLISLELNTKVQISIKLDS